MTNFVPFLFKPNRLISALEYTSVKLLKSAADTKNLKYGKAIHAHLVISNYTPEQYNLAETNSLINLYAKCNELPTARRLFDKMPERNIVSWSALMAGYLHNGNAYEVIGLFKDMLYVSDPVPNEYIVTTIISSCSDNKRFEEGMQCHGYVLKSGLEFHQYVKNTLIQLYSKSSDVHGAMKILYNSPGCDISCYNLIMNGLLENDHIMEARQVLGLMIGEGIVLDNVSYVAIFCLCACLKDLKLGMQVHGQMLKNNIDYDVYIGSKIIDMYGKCCKVLFGKNVFDKLRNRNVFTWTAAMAAFFQNGCFEEALNLFSKMELENISPNEFTFSVLLNSSAGLSALNQGSQLHARVKKSGFKSHLIVGNALIVMYSKCGEISSANLVFLAMKNRDIVTWNAMISGFSHHGLGKEALNAFWVMLKLHECPNYVTFIAVLSACSHVGLVNEGFYFLNQLMKQMGIEPGVEHYTCMIGLLSKAGLLEQAENFMKSTPIKWDVVAWRTLLNACHVHKNLVMGKRIADIVFKMDGRDEGTYTLLSNMYAKARRWDGVVMVRKVMRDTNIKKEPGVSWLEIKNTTHVFFPEDDKHPEIRLIYRKVAELLGKIKALGYNPDIGSVLHDVEDGEKQVNLSYHSEKLAIAYGVMKTPYAAPIRVIKNLRMCDDCHVAVKLISKVEGRVIVVRDANRFHHFRDGFCSCRDYW